MSDSKCQLAAIVAGSALLLFASLGFAWMLSAAKPSPDLAATTQSH